jgi:hypothetical protein
MRISAQQQQCHPRPFKTISTSLVIESLVIDCFVRVFPTREKEKDCAVTGGFSCYLTKICRSQLRIL